MAQATSEKLTLNYPLYCGEFVTDKLLVVAGGGGEGRSGIPNKISLIDVKEVPNTLTEIDLSRGEDAVMSLGIRRGDSGDDEKVESVTLLTGINSSEAELAVGKNSHFRTFDLTVSPTPGIKARDSIKLFSQPKEQNEIYQRLLRISPSRSLVVIATGGGRQSAPGASEIVLVNAQSKDVIGRIIPESGKEVEDLDIYTLANGNERLAFCTSTEVFAQDITAGSQGIPKSLYIVPTAAPKPAIRAVRFISSEIIAIIQNLPSRTGANLLIIETTGKILARKRLPKHIKAVTSLDVTFISRPQTPSAIPTKIETTKRTTLPPIAQYAIALSAADMSLSTYLLDIDFTHGKASLQPYQSFRNTHPFQITKVTFGPISTPAPPSSTPSSPSSPTFPTLQKPYLPLASTSMGNTVVIHKFPLLFVPTPNTTPTNSDGEQDTDAEATANNSPGAYYLRVPGVKRQSILSVTVSLALVIVLAIAMQVVFVRRGGLLNLNDWSEITGSSSSVAGPFDGGSGGFSQFGGKVEKCDMGCAKKEVVQEVAEPVEVAVEVPVVNIEIPPVESETVAAKAEDAEVPVKTEVRDEL